ncbi:hypothetical protein PPYR_10621 [Photinus pyralis]|uniref:guanylate kinase n=1 Tax=Photinus pyralis TaxID=7054 RepID=A0A5N4AGS0_PHOPY|nr:hypothetical protein PPYR_10621 [Photinus pyralis]
MLCHEIKFIEDIKFYLDDNDRKKCEFELRPTFDFANSIKRESQFAHLTITINFIRALHKMATNGPKPLVFCGPSGSGKSTMLTKLLVDYPTHFGFSVSHTTRLPREGEVDGVHYHFTTVKQMKEDINEGKFIESATFGGNMYGTSIKAVEVVRDSGKVCILDIDVQGVKQVKQTSLNPWYVFVKPPSLDALEERLKKRKTENLTSLTLRLQAAQKEIEYGEEAGNFDLLVINDDLHHAYDEIKKFVEDKVLCGNNIG